MASVDDMNAAQNLGVALANKLLNDGADEILTAIKQQLAVEITRQRAEKLAAKSAVATENKANESL